MEEKTQGILELKSNGRRTSPANSVRGKDGKLLGEREGQRHIEWSDYTEKESWGGK